MSYPIFISLMYGVNEAPLSPSGRIWDLPTFFWLQLLSCLHLCETEEWIACALAHLHTCGYASDCMPLPWELWGGWGAPACGGVFFTKRRNHVYPRWNSTSCKSQSEPVWFAGNFKYSKLKSAAQFWGSNEKSGTVWVKAYSSRLCSKFIGEKERKAENWSKFNIASDHHVWLCHVGITRVTTRMCKQRYFLQHLRMQSFCPHHADSVYLLGMWLLL